MIIRNFGSLYPEKWNVYILTTAKDNEDNWQITTIPSQI